MTFSGVASDPIAPWQVIVLATAVGVLLLLSAMWRRRDGLRWTWAARTGALLMAAGLALGLQVGTNPATYLDTPDVQVIVALDRTASMAVRDEEGASRLSRAVRDIALVGPKPDVYVSLITWAQRARVVLPFTTDETSVARTASLLEPEHPRAGIGSSMNRPRSMLAQVITQATTEHPDRATFVLIMTDGEDTERGKSRSYDSIASPLAGGLVIGYGSEAGGPVPIDPARPTPVVIDPRTDCPAISSRDADNLRRVAGDLEIAYVGRDDPSFVETLTLSLQPPLHEVATSTPRSFAWLLALLLTLFALPDLRAICLASRELRELGRSS